MIAVFCTGALIFGLGVIFGSSITRGTYQSILGSYKENNGIQ